MIIKAISFSRNKENQDSFVVLPDEGFVICDGVGSAPFAKETAQFFTSKFKEIYQVVEAKALLRRSPYGPSGKKQDITNKSINRIIYKLFLDLKKQVGQDAWGWQTTFISVIRVQENTYKIAWLGNGGIFVIRSEYLTSEFKPLVNLLIPDVDSRGFLTKVFNPVRFCQPNVIELFIPEPVLILACTDGVFSPEQVQIVKDTNNEKFYQERSEILDFIFKSISISNGDSDIDGLIENALIETERRFSCEIEDDATIAILVDENFFTKTK